MRIIRIFFLALLSVATGGIAAQAIDIAPTMTARSGAGAAISKGHVFLVGGINGTSFLPGVEIAPLLPGGGIGAWKQGPKLNMERGFTTATVWGDWLYVLGGANGKNGVNLLATVERARINLDGTLGPWVLEPKLMQTSRRGTVAVAYNGQLYAFGGYSGMFLPTVERAKINPDGSLEPWIYDQSELGDARYIHGGALSGNTLYAVGGHNEATGAAYDSVEYSRINPDGSLGPWKKTSKLIEGRYLTASAVAEGYLYVFGGFNGKSYMQAVEKARVELDGSLGPWEKTAPMSVPREGLAPVAHMDNIYLIGGSNRDGYLASTEYGRAAAAGDVGKWAALPAIKEAKSHAQAPEPPAVQYTRSGIQLMEEGKLGDAAFAFTSAIKADKNQAEAHFYLGIIYLQTGKNRDAVASFQNAVKAAPKNSEFHYNLACAYAKDGQLKPGLASLKKALDLGFDKNAAKTDKDLDNLRKDPGFSALFKGKKKAGK